MGALIAKLRVYTISDQDDAGPWLRKEFPGLFYIVSPSNTDSSQFQRATWTGISGDRFYQNSVSHVIDMVLNPWLEKNIMSKGPLGAFYPRLSFIMEGDTPSFLGLINNGLGWSESPAYGGWGGVGVKMKSPDSVVDISGLPSAFHERLARVVHVHQEGNDQAEGQVDAHGEGDHLDRLAGLVDGDVDGGH